jgi:hypothetical protein
MSFLPICTGSKADAWHRSPLSYKFGAVAKEYKNYSRF